MKRREFITKGIGAGIATQVAHPLLAGEWSEDKPNDMGPYQSAYTEKLPVFWNQLTAPYFKRAVEQAEGVCIIPMGVIEKHGPHLPLGTDVFRAKEMCKRAAEQEYAIVFPDFFAGQIFEAKHQPGTVAYSTELMLHLLDETCKEIARNGLKKIIIVNTHGGNDAFLPYFLQIQLESARDYTVFLFQPQDSEETQKQIAALRKSKTGGHADEIETGEILAICPEYVRMDQVGEESGQNMKRLNVPHSNTGISWYAQYPNHYAGESSGATAELGEVRLAARSAQLAKTIKAIKGDTATRLLQDEFYKNSAAPLKTGKW